MTPRELRELCERLERAACVTPLNLLFCCPNQHSVQSIYVESRMSSLHAPHANQLATLRLL